MRLREIKEIEWIINKKGKKDEEEEDEKEENEKKKKYLRLLKMLIKMDLFMLRNLLLKKVKMEKKLLKN